MRVITPDQLDHCARTACAAAGDDWGDASPEARRGWVLAACAVLTIATSHTVRPEDRDEVLERYPDPEEDEA